MIITIKSILTVLLFICLFKMPYWYYQVVRFAVCYGLYNIFIDEKERKQYVICALCFIVAVLFNPILIVHFDRDIWQKIDVSLAIVFIVWIVNDIFSIYAKKDESTV